MLQNALPRLSIICSAYDLFQCMYSYEIEAKTPKQILVENPSSFDLDGDCHFQTIYDADDSSRLDIFYSEL